LETETARLLPKWRSHARGLMADAVKGDDLLSETLLKILENQREKAERLAVEGTLEFYVNRSLFLMAIDRSSRYHIKFSKFSRQWDENSSKHLEEPLSPWLGSRIDNEYLDAYISLMPQMDAVILRLYAMPDFSYKDASSKTGIPVKTLYKLVENAITRIKKNVHRTPSNSGPTSGDVSGL
jgi:DNA-directed RNA polymerase specialized sigma24 family protein